MFLCLSWELSRWAILKQWGNKNQEKMVRQEILKRHMQRQNVCCISNEGLGWGDAGHVHLTKLHCANTHYIASQVTDGCCLVLVLPHVHRCSLKQMRSVEASACVEHTCCVIQGEEMSCNTGLTMDTAFFCPHPHTVDMPMVWKVGHMNWKSWNTGFNLALLWE